MAEEVDVVVDALTVDVAVAVEVAEEIAMAMASRRGPTTTMALPVMEGTLAEVMAAAAAVVEASTKTGAPTRPARTSLNGSPIGTTVGRMVRTWSSGIRVRRAMLQRRAMFGRRRVRIRAEEG